ncbi:MAG: molecular chaperone TorD family protein [Coriobacteriia bacterium]|nr:molecular chaperone TorD family protein [Coriobacteriia bacterium]MBS5478707.1 molecular chaperone TorD family protein [Coriobacteriia bacterium]
MSEQTKGACGCETAAETCGGTAEATVLDAAQFEALAVIFGVLGRLFWEEPEAGVVDQLADARELLLAPPFSTVASEGARALCDVLTAYGEAGDEGRAAMMAEMRQDRAYLFYQVSVSRTSPYESVYRTEDRTLFGPPTAQVKADYERHGLTLGTGRNEPCDHFGLECTYLAQVAAAGADAAGEAAAGASCELRRFLGEHLLVFAPVYLPHVEMQARSGLYRATAILAREILAWAAGRLGAAAVVALDPADFPLKHEAR